MLTTSGESGYPCLFLVLGGETRSSFRSECDVCCEFCSGYCCLRWSPLEPANAFKGFHILTPELCRRGNGLL